MSKFEESNFYKALQDFFINADKKTFLQFLAEFYNRTEGIIDKNNIQDDLIKELRELYLEFNEKGIDENVVREKVNYFLENSVKIKDIIAKLNTNTNNLEKNTLELTNYKDNTFKRFNQAIFSFSDDDGDTDLLTTIIPLSKELNVPFTIYTWYNSPIFNNYGDMQNMYWNYGWEFGFHTTGKITEQTDEVIHKAIIEFKNNMGKLGFHVDTFAYGY